MTKKDPDEVPSAEAARRRDAALLKMLKTPPKKHADAKKPRAKEGKPRDAWRPK